jgi:hypothetical protein
MALIPPFFLDCVVAIGFRDSKGTIAFSGTGFLVGRLDRESHAADTTKKPYRLFLATNRHVLACFEMPKSSSTSFAVRNTFCSTAMRRKQV